MLQIALNSKAKKDLAKISKKERLRLLASLAKLRSSPYLGKRLAGKFQDCYSLRVWSYRLIYQVKEQQSLILVVRLGHRREVYR